MGGCKRKVAETVDFSWVLVSRDYAMSFLFGLRVVFLLGLHDGFCGGMSFFNGGMSFFNGGMSCF